MITCPQCGNQLEPGTVTCPACGTPQAKPGFMGMVQGVVSGVLATTKTNPKAWMIGGGVGAVAAIVAVLFLTGVFGPSGKAICTAALDQAKDYGVISPSATLASNSAKSTDVKNRKSCTAQVDSDTFILQADLKTEATDKKPCKDMKQPGCVALYSVARSDGVTTYQVRQIPPDETDEALAASEGQQVPPPPGAAPPSGSDAGAIDTETATDNSAAGSAPAQSAPPSDQPQQ